MSKKKATAICLPMSRTSRIMNSAIGVDCVNQDIVALATKATEIFIQDITRKAYEISDDHSNAITYDDVQRLVHQEPQYDFLVDWIPKMIKYGDALRQHEETMEHDQKRLEHVRKLQEEHMQTLRRAMEESKATHDKEMKLSKTTDTLHEDSGAAKDTRQSENINDRTD